MSSLQIPFLSSSSSSFSQKRVHAYAAIAVPELTRVRISLPKIPILSSTKLVHEFNGSIQTIVPSQKDVVTTTSQKFQLDSCDPNKCKDIIQLYAILKVVADSVEMQKKIGQKRNNWSSLLLNSINIMMVRLNPAIIHNTAFKLTSTLLFTATKGILLIINKIQTSKRNVTTSFKRLQIDIQTKLTNDYQMRVFESKKTKTNNGWTPELEMEMRQIIEAVKRKEMEDYDKRLGNLALKVNKTLAILGPLFTAIAALGSALERHGLSSWAGIVAVTAGLLAEFIHPLEGMAFEMYRNCTGGFLQDTIEATLEEKDWEKRENGEVFEMKVAMKLGRSVCRLRQLAAKYAACDDDSEEGIAVDEFSLQVMYSILT